MDDQFLNNLQNYSLADGFIFLIKGGIAVATLFGLGKLFTDWVKRVWKRWDKRSDAQILNEGEKIKAETNDKAAIMARLASVEKRLDGLTEKYTEVKVENAGLIKENGFLKHENEQLRAESEKSKGRISQLETEVSELRTQLSKLTEPRIIEAH